VSNGEKIHISVDVRNVGKRDGEEVVQLYVTDLEASVPVPIRSLQGFRRIALKVGEKRTVSFVLDPRQVSLIDAAGRRVIEPGEFGIAVGGKQPGFKGLADSPTTGVVTGRFTLTGSALYINEKVNQ
jgi:beta-glucosidase